MLENSAASSAPTGPNSRREVDWLLTDIDWIVTCDDAMRCIEDGAIAIEGGRLAAIGPNQELAGKFRGRRQISLQGHLAAPGLINAHTHAAMSCLRGLADDLPLQRWLHEVIFPTEARHVSPEFVYWGTLLAAAEMLQNGVTTFCDGYFFELSAAEAARDIGSRAVLAQGILDFPTPDQPDPSQARACAEDFLGHFSNNGDRLRPSLFCHAPYTCGAETLRWVKQLCRQQGILFQVHLSETAEEAAQLTEKYGARPVSYLDRLGVLDELTLCAHGIWLQDDEIELLAKSKSGVSHNIESNMKLAAGVAPVPAMLKAGVCVALGTDSCASNNDLDLFSEMDKVAKLHKVIQHDPVVCSAHEVLRMATVKGATALGWKDQIGSLEVGKQADIIAIDLVQPHLVPLYDPVSQLVYAARGSDVRRVWVGGEMVVADGRIQTLDLTEVLREVRKIAERIKGS